MKAIPLTNSDAVALVDDEDFEQLSRFSWRLHNANRGQQGYAARWDRERGRLNLVLMHRQITNAPRGTQVDHANGSGLDNRKVNLRFATHSQQMRNRGAFRRRVDAARRHSRFKGVSWDNADGRWETRIRINGRQVRLGRFRNEDEGARAYDVAARRIFGRFARLNFPQQGEVAAV